MKTLRGNGKCKGPEVDTSVVCSGLRGARPGREVGDEVREVTRGQFILALAALGKTWLLS